MGSAVEPGRVLGVASARWNDYVGAAEADNIEAALADRASTSWPKSIAIATASWESS
jgi:hypothetical protein